MNCSKSNQEETAACGGVTEFTLNEPFLLCYGVNAHLEGNDNFIVSFHSLYGDSRCPNSPDILCVWQGRVDAGFTASLGQIGTSDTLSAEGLSNPPVFDSTLFLTYKIKLLAIEPYPTGDTAQVLPEQYKLKLLITQ